MAGSGHPARAPRRLLIRAPNWLGDMIMALPAIRLIRRSHPDACIAVAAAASGAALFSCVAEVDEVISLPAGRGLGGLRRLADDVEQLETAEADATLLLTNSFSSAWAASRAGIRERWGYRTDARRWLLTRAVRRRDARPRSAHHAESYLALVRALGLADQEPPTEDMPYLRPTDAARVRARKLLLTRGWDPSMPLVGIAPGAAYGRAKQYPPELMATVVYGLASAGWAPVLVGARDDEATGRAIERDFRALLGRSRLMNRPVSVPIGPSTGMPMNAPINLIAKTDLATLLGLVDLCRAFVSNDSGAMHVAAALGTPVVAIFGSTDEHATRPIGRHALVRAEVWCRPCLLRECPIDHRCMRRIPPTDVVDAVKASVKM